MKDQRHPGEASLLNYSAGLSVDAELKDHVEQCPACKEKVAALRREQSEFNAPADAEDKLDEYLQRYHDNRRIVFLRSVRWASAAGIVLLLAGVFTFLIVRQPDTSRVKGSVSANVYVKRGKEVVQADEDFIYKKGDKVRLGVLSPAPIFVTVLVEREGGLSPISSLTDVAVSPGKEVILPGSLFLDCSHDTETLQLRVSRKRSVGSETDGGSYSRAIVFKCERQ